VRPERPDVGKEIGSVESGITTEDELIEAGDCWRLLGAGEAQGCENRVRRVVGKETVIEAGERFQIQLFVRCPGSTLQRIGGERT